MGERKTPDLKVRFDGRIRLQFHGAKVSSDAGLLAVRELDQALGLTELAGSMLVDTRSGRNVQHNHVGLLRQSVCSRLASYKAGTYGRCEEYQTKQKANGESGL